ncbi:MarR family transcriptional regulator [Streptomyces sp. NPDC005408]|uniref:MarR family winged helix-turn-helix transcriptional regulator n=1 Tax=Streptomyces sp. NPDC005408 TaxID=3155341 RepID=UPI0033A68F49
MANTPLGDQWLSLVRICTRMNQAIEHTLADRHGLCVGAYEIMDVMGRTDGWIRLGELTARASRSQPQVSRLLAQMVKEGYADREPSPGDGRGAQVRLTPAGRKAFQKAAAEVEGVLEKLAEESTNARALMSRPLPDLDPLSEPDSPSDGKSPVVSGAGRRG